ncbi:MAG: TolC family protein [Elusimicrobia bacterium]|nr:TolC family protein [Elusimicrobiota bacterium]
MTRLLALAFLVCLPAASRAQPAALTLRQAFDSALRNSESIAINQQEVRRAEALYREALRGELPTLDLAADASWEGRPTSNRLSNADTEAAFRLTKTGLSGYRELAAIRAAGHDSARRRHLRARAEQLLLGDVSGAFFGMLQSQENVAATEELIKLAGARLSELRERVRVGRTREADAIGQEFQVATLRSQLEESSRQVQARSDLLSFLMREPVPALRSGEAPFLELPPIERFLSRVGSRPDVVAASESAQAAAALVRLARADHLPELGFQARWFPHRPASQLSNRWDATLGMAVPLWGWGAVSASVEAARAELTQEELTLQALRRAAELDVRNAYRDYSSARRQLDVRRQAMDLARRDYELQSRDERRGLVTSLEALESLNRLNGARLAYNNALLAVRLASVSLDIASGEPIEEVELLK